MTELFDSLLAAPVLRTFVQYLIAFCSRPKTAGDVVSRQFVKLIVADKSLLKPFSRNSTRSHIGGDIFDICFATSPTVSDFISCVVVGQTGTDINVEFSGSSSNLSWDIRAAHFVMDDDERRTNEQPTEIITCFG